MSRNFQKAEEFPFRCVSVVNVMWCKMIFICINVAEKHSGSVQGPAILRNGYLSGEGSTSHLQQDVKYE